eukprot:g1735.t1
MAPQMSKTAAAAAVVAGTAFVSLPSQRVATPTARPALRGNASGSISATGMSTVGAAALGATLVAAVRKSGRVGQTSRGAFENELGVQPPLGFWDPAGLSSDAWRPPLGFWDPAGLSSDGDAREFYRRRVVEIKHGRVSMLACTGDQAADHQRD